MISEGGYPLLRFLFFPYFLYFLYRDPRRGNNGRNGSGGGIGNPRLDGTGGKQVIRYSYDPKAAREQGGMWRPVFVCDTCLRIIQGDDGVAVWTVDGSAWHVHKGDCDQRLCTDFGKPLSAPLKDHAGQLRQNLDGKVCAETEGISDADLGA